MKSRLWIILALTVLLLACVLSDVAQKVLEPIDAKECEETCKLCQYQYVYRTNSCFCICTGVEVQMY